jgi:hypothetical protein
MTDINNFPSKSLAEQNQAQLSHYLKSILKLDNQPDNNLYFFSLHYNYPQQSLKEANDNYRKMLAPILSRLFGKKWYKKPGFTIIEHGKRGVLHAHSVINILDKTENDLKEALDYVVAHRPDLNLTCRITHDNPDRKTYIPRTNDLLIKPEYYLQGLIGYLMKEYNFDKSHIDFDNFFPHELFFDKELLFKTPLKRLR